MNAPVSITITPVRVADLLAEGERMPVYVHVIDHPGARVLVDTGMTELHPAAAGRVIPHARNGGVGCRTAPPTGEGRAHRSHVL